MEPLAMLGTKLERCERCAQRTFHVVEPDGSLRCHRCAAKALGAQLRRKERRRPRLALIGIALVVVGAVGVLVAVLR